MKAVVLIDTRPKEGIILHVWTTPTIHASCVLLVIQVMVQWRWSGKREEGDVHEVSS